MGTLGTLLKLRGSPTLAEHEWLVKTALDLTTEIRKDIQVHFLRFKQTGGYSQFKGVPAGS